jgi:hypothetical protein
MRKRAVALICLGGIATICAMIAMYALPVLSVSAQGQERRYFAETGHYVSGDFLRFYDQRGGLAIFGYPLTKEFKHDGRTVQYFQRARMEKHPENPDPYKVQLGLLGDELGYRQSPIPESEIPSANHPDKQYFAETGHTISFAFLDFYRANGGLDIFGYPISEWVIEPNGRIVQYFQRGKMEWYPEGETDQRVQLGMLGTIYVDQFVDPEMVKKEENNGPYIRTGTPAVTEEPASSATPVASKVTDLQISVTLKHPIIGLEGTQTAYVYIFDQDRHGVAGAAVEMEVQYKEGRTDHYVLEKTNSNGYCQLDFEIADPAPGYVVVVKLTAQYEELKAETGTAFLPWW